ncbi:Imm21 family immunity protein [Promicromonospora sp. NPDC057488]|uniref:Imm21 family immunity protein n=1 Tax=Promicromonospora sp. NPDC057488 TaxID=3346147 RepID=UPI00366BDAA6
MRWLESTGGPMVVLPAEATAAWSGYRGPDYDLACSVYDIGMVDVVGAGRTFSALSLSGEPMSTAWSADLGCVVQWRWAEDEDDLLRTIRSSWNGLRWDAVGSVDWQGGARMFDAATPGDELTSDEFVEWSIGDRGVSVMVAEVDEGSAACRLIRTVPLESAP